MGGGRSLAPKTVLRLVASNLTVPEHITFRPVPAAPLPLTPLCIPTGPSWHGSMLSRAARWRLFIE